MPSYQVSLPASNNTKLKDGAGDGGRKVCLCLHKQPVDF